MSAARTSHGRAVRVAAAVRVVWGLWTLTGRARATGAHHGGGARAMTVLLGLRHVVQATLVLGRPDDPPGRGGAVDAAHAASKLLLAALSRRWRPVALGQAATATICAALAELAGRLDVAAAMRSAVTTDRGGVSSGTGHDGARIRTDGT